MLINGILPCSLLAILVRQDANEGAKTTRLMPTTGRSNGSIPLRWLVFGLFDSLTGAPGVERENFFASIGRLITPGTFRGLAKWRIFSG